MAKAKGKRASGERRILRAIHVGNPGEVKTITPGMEDQLEEELTKYNESLPEEQQFDVQAELDRLETNGVVSGFGKVDENASLEVRFPDPNIRAVNQKVKQQKDVLDATNAQLDADAEAEANAAEDDESRAKRNARGGRRMRGAPATAARVPASATTKRAAERQKHDVEGKEVKIDHGAEELDDEDFEPEDEELDSDAETPQPGAE